MPYVEGLRGRWWALVVTVLAWGCSTTSSTRSAEQLVSALRQALQEGDAAAAYELLSETQKANLSRDDFIHLVKAERSESNELSKALEAPVSVHVEAYVQLADGRRLRLLRERDGFRLDEPLLALHDRSTPRAALVAFVRAIERRRWDILLTLMPSEDAKGLDPAKLAESLAPELEQLTRMAALLQTALQAPIEIVGDRATLPYGEGATVRFVRETDGWKVEAPE